MDVPCDDRDQAWPLFLATYGTLIEILEHELQTERGLPLTWFDVLIQLSFQPHGRMRMQDLADRVLLSKSGVTRLVDRMTKAGLIARVPCETDRRVVFAELTSEGRAKLTEASPVAFRGVAEHFTQHLGRAEHDAIMSGFRKILDAARARTQEERAAS